MSLDLSVFGLAAAGVSSPATPHLDVYVFWSNGVQLQPDRWEHRLSDSHWRLYRHDREGGILTGPDGIPFPLLPREVYLIPPGLGLSTHCASPFRQFYLHFDLMGFPPLGLRDLFPAPVAVPHSEAFGASVDELDAALRGHSPADPAFQYWRKGIACEAVGRCLTAVPEENRERYRQRLSALGPVLPALREIERRLPDRALTNGLLAAVCSMSEDHFIRRFAEAAGTSPARYVTERRVARAAQLLLFTDHSLDRVAELTGFRDRFYFSRVFARATGRPPAAFRRDGRP